MNLLTQTPLKIPRFCVLPPNMIHESTRQLNVAAIAIHQFGRYLQGDKFSLLCKKHKCMNTGWSRNLHIATRTQTHTHAHARTCTHASTHAHTSTPNSHTHACAYMPTNIHACMQTYMHACKCTNINTPTHAYTNLYLFSYNWTPVVQFYTEIFTEKHIVFDAIYDHFLRRPAPAPPFIDTDTYNLKLTCICKTKLFSHTCKCLPMRTHVKCIFYTHSTQTYMIRSGFVRDFHAHDTDLLWSLAASVQV